tara:strand:- start:895 stop:1110 length:216 start_codon:yes stop_codon:yes gene_type:complete
VGKDRKEEFGGIKTAKPGLFKPIQCKDCGKTMQWQISEVDCLIHCQECRRAVVVSDWQTNAELFGKKPGND